ncbi:coiled-coil domain-containing protein [Paenibacillus sp. GCM10023252]|uniref:coiled-coil domain-containing protein n=1 Tax=Paenibacillus sp. GCM10023252 TaxID=3252649 RepID=UPI00360ED672
MNAMTTVRTTFQPGWTREGVHITMIPIVLVRHSRVWASRVWAAAIVLMLLMIQPAVLAESSEPGSTADTSEIQSLLEQSLSIVELDKEIARTQARQTEVQAEMTQSEAKLAQQQVQIKDKKRKAGSVLRAYYMGERDVILYALLSMRSISDVMTSLDYLDLIMEQDRQTLDAYTNEYAHIRRGLQKLTDEQKELSRLEVRLQTARTRVTSLEEQLEGKLNGRSDEERIRLLIQELQASWETDGIAEVKQYFRAMSRAMQKLPGWVQENKEYMEINGLRYTLHVPEEELNQFLRDQDPLFDNFAFVFGDGIITAEGERDGMAVSVSGRYTVEDKPKNGIYFHIDKLLFNGFALPDTTRLALQEEFDLGFYPSKILSFVKAEKVTIADGELIVELSLKL